MSDRSKKSESITEQDFTKKDDDLDLFGSIDKYQNTIKDVFHISNSLASDILHKSSNLVDEFSSILRGGPNEDEDDDLFLNDIKKLDRLMNNVTGGLIGNPFNINYKPLSDKSTGYWAYPSPSSEIYDACKEKNGLSVWDEQGYWRCLFPRLVIPANKLGKVLTKEDVLEDADHKNGLFFQDFNKYLDWKSNMKKVLREEKLKKLEELRAQREKARKEFDFDSLKNSEFDNVTSVTSPTKFSEEKKITGTKQYVYTTNNNGVIEETKKFYEYYDDGSSSVKEITKKFDQNVDEKPVIEEKVETFPSTKKTGWFWDNSDD